MLYAFTENFILPFSHDEVVHGKRAMLDKMPGDGWQKFATLRALYGYMFGHPGKKLLFMGGEFGQWREWNHDGSLDWHLLEYPLHAGLQRLVRDLNDPVPGEPALHEVDFEPAGFQWIDCNDNENSVVSFDPARAGSARLHGDGAQLHAGAARRVPHRRARGRPVRRAAEQRRRDLRRDERRQHGRGSDRGGGGARPRPVAEPRGAAALVRDLQAGAVGEGVSPKD